MGEGAGATAGLLGWPYIAAGSWRIGDILVLLHALGKVRLENFTLVVERRKRAKGREGEGEGEAENSRGKGWVSHSSTITCVNRACFRDGVGLRLVQTAASERRTEDIRPYTDSGEESLRSALDNRLALRTCAS